MHILLIKMSSMGDLIHTLPALTDALQAIPGITIDWVVEPAFSDFPVWHPAVKTVISLPLRRWKKNIFSRQTLTEAKIFYQQLREKKYDLIIDAQGLLKSMIIAKCARGKSVGYDKQSAREWLASFGYQQKYCVSKQQHAVNRIRELFSKALHYVLPTTTADFHIDHTKLPSLHFQLPEKYFVFLHGTTWDSKHYPEIYWQQLIEKSGAKNIAVYLPWGNDIEKQRAERLAKASPLAAVLPKLSIAQLATLLKNATQVVTVDTGLGHLSAALNTPTLSLYGPTDPKKIGMVGKNQIHLAVKFPCAPCKSRTCFYAKRYRTDISPTCFQTITPDSIAVYCLPD